VDLAKLEAKVLNEEEWRVLREWKQSLHPKASISKASGEASGSSPPEVIAIKATVSTHMLGSSIIPGYNPDKPHIAPVTSGGSVAAVESSSEEVYH